MKTTMLSIGALAMTLGAVALPAAPAAAQSYRDGYYGQRYGDRYDRYDRSDRYERARYRDYRGDRGYAYRGRYAGNRYERCKDGDGGTLIGAIAGGLLGNQVAGRGGDRLLGTVLGGAVGAVAGRAIDRSDPVPGCRRR